MRRSIVVTEYRCACCREDLMEGTPNRYYTALKKSYLCREGPDGPARGHVVEVVGPTNDEISEALASIQTSIGKVQS